MVAYFEPLEGRQKKKHQTLDVFEKCLSIVRTSIHLDFLTLTPFLLPILASDKASLFASLLSSTMARVAADCSLRL